MTVLRKWLTLSSKSPQKSQHFFAALLTQRLTQATKKEKKRQLTFVETSGCTVCPQLMQFCVVSATASEKFNQFVRSQLHHCKREEGGRCATEGNQRSDQPQAILLSTVTHTWSLINDVRSSLGESQSKDVSLRWTF